ncbi:MAG: Hsp20 family protein [Patescibacteria group bacterium]
MSAELRLLLRDLRLAQELSQDELARQLGISRQSIISLEQGAYLPSFPLLINMIQFFNCDLEELVEGLRADIEQLPSEVNSTQKFLGRAEWQESVGSPTGAINIRETETNYEIIVQAPGFKENKLNLEFSGDTLTISGEIPAVREELPKVYIRHEWEASSFSRSIRFASPIDESEVEAKLADGTLTIHVPKMPPAKQKVTKIEVKK